MCFSRFLFRRLARFWLAWILLLPLSAVPVDASQPDSLVALGERLFYDARLSRDGMISCGSCHQPSKAYADGRAVATGIGSNHGVRNVPSLLYISRRSSFFWDGRRTSLEALVFDPILNPVEMGMPTEVAALEAIEADKDLSGQFKRIFPQENGIISIKNMRFALAAFVRSLDRGRNAYDRFLHDPARFPLPAEAQAGLSLFGGKAGCSGCHLLGGSPALLMDDRYHHTSVGWQRVEHLLPAVTKEVLRENLDESTLGHRVTADPAWAALGRFAVTHKPADLGAFRTPSLRNVAVTAPYMHDGSVATLREAIDVEIYYRSLAAGTPLSLTASERRALLAFLMCLTDEP